MQKNFLSIERNFFLNFQPSVFNAINGTSQIVQFATLFFRSQSHRTHTHTTHTTHIQNRIAVAINILLDVIRLIVIVQNENVLIKSNSILEPIHY